MLYTNLKKFVKKFPTLWNLLRRLKDNLLALSRFKDVFMMMLVLHVWPEQTYRFSTRRLLPNKKKRFFKNKKPTIPFDLIKSKSNKIPTMKEVNAIGRGNSFKLNNLKKIKGPTFLMSFWVPVKKDNKDNVIYTYENLRAKEMSKYASKVKHHYDITNLNTLKNFKRKNFTYVIPRYRYINSLKKKGYNVLTIIPYYLDKNGKIYSASKAGERPGYQNMFNNKNCKLISMIEKVYRPPVEKTVIPMDRSKPLYATTPTYSFFPQLCGLTFFAKKINVYGWDFYLKSSPEEMNYWQLLFNMYNFKLDIRSRNHFEAAIINFYYGYQFSKMSKFKIYGYMGQLGKHEKLIKRIERVLFN